MAPLDPRPTASRSPRTLRRARLLALGVAAAFAVSGCGSGDDGDKNGAPRLEEAGDITDVEHDYLIPPGTGDALDAGEKVEILPAVLEAEVGEAIRIVNADERGHVVGVFFVGAGETLTQTFTAPGEFSGSCTVHTDGEFTLRVTE